MSLAADPSPLASSASAISRSESSSDVRASGSRLIQLPAYVRLRCRFEMARKGAPVLDDQWAVLDEVARIGATRCERHLSVLISLKPFSGPAGLDWVRAVSPRSAPGFGLFGCPSSSLGRGNRSAPTSGAHCAASATARLERPVTPWAAVRVSAATRSVSLRHLPVARRAVRWRMGRLSRPTTRHRRPSHSDRSRRRRRRHRRPRRTRSRRAATHPAGRRRRRTRVT